MPHTLDSRIDVAPGTFGKNNKRNPLNKRSHLKIKDNLIFLYIAKVKKVEKNIIQIRNKKVNKCTPFNKHIASDPPPPKKK